MRISNWRRVAARLAVVLPLVIAPVGAYGWAAASHAWMAKSTFKKAGITDPFELCQRIYGANAVDMFNTVFTSEGQALAALLHDPDAVIADVPFGLAATPLERAFAYGFASHNERWGTDATSHYAGRTLGEDEGYVIAKAAVMAGWLRDAVLPLVGSEEMLLFVSHILTEHSIDLLLVGAEPQVALDLMESSGCPGPAMGEFLERALGAPFDGAIAGTPEELFRYGLFVNGAVLSQPDARQQLAGLIALQAKAFLPGPFPPDEELVALIDQALLLGMYLNAPDYLGELEATRGWVNGRLSSLGISP